MAWSIFTDGGGDAVAVAWAKQLLQNIGAPVSASNVQFVYDWEKSEGGGGKYNPLNQGPVPGHPELTTTGSQYGGGAADYASWQAGLQGATDYLNMPNYTHVLAALKSGDSSGARNALWASPWAASHYGYGSAWYSGSIPGGSNAIPAGFSFGDNTSGDVGSTADETGNQDNCLIGSGGGKTYNWFWLIPGQKQYNTTAGTCYFPKTAARALIGGMLLGVSLVVFLAGSAVLVAYGFKRTGATTAVGNALAVVPGPTRKAGNAIKKAGS